MKRLITLILAGLMLFSMSSAIAEPAAIVPDTSLSGEITHWVWGDYEVKGASDFNKYYPNIKVNYVFIPQDEYTTKLQTAIASGLDLPDVVNLEMTPRAMFLSFDAWQRLDEPPYNLNKDELVPFSVPLVSNPNGEIVSVQIDNCVGGYVYNRELAKKYLGTDDPAELEKLLPTLDSLLELSKRVSTESNGTDFLYPGVDDAFMAAFGLYTSEALVTDNKLTLDSSFLPAYQFCEQLVKNNAVNKYMQWTPAWNTAFSANNYLFFPGPSWYISFVVKTNDPDSVGKYGLMTPPGGGFSWGGTSYSIPKNRPDEQKQLAWAYIKWFTMSVEGNRNFVKAQSTPTLYLPSFETDMYSNNADPYFAGQDIIAKLLEIAQNPNTNVRPMTKYDSRIMDVNNQVLRDIEQGMSAVDALAKLKTEVLVQLAGEGITQ